MLDLNERIAELRTAADNLASLVDYTVSWDEFWKQFPLTVDINNEFEISEGEGGDNYPVYDGDQWTQVCYSFDYGRDVGGLYIGVHEGDADGNWECVGECRGDNFQELYNEWFSMNLYFASWAEYHLWCAENGGVDPLEQFFDHKPTVERHLEAAHLALNA